MTLGIFIFPNKEPNSVSSVRFNSTEPFCSCFSSLALFLIYVFICMQLGISIIFLDQVYGK